MENEPGQNAPWHPPPVPGKQRLAKLEMKAIDRANKEIAAGRLWRAKEILSGSLMTYPFEPELYAAYGELLFRLGDMREAGKFLFLAGRDSSSEAVQVYLRQSKAADKNAFYATFPARARLATLAEYPPSVAEELKRRGFGEVIRRPPAASQPATWADKIKIGIFIGVAFLVLFLLAMGVLRLMILGGQTVYEWLQS